MPPTVLSPGTGVFVPKILKRYSWLTRSWRDNSGSPVHVTEITVAVMNEVEEVWLCEMTPSGPDLSIVSKRCNRVHKYRLSLA